MDNHDSAYRKLFSHPEMIRDLLLGFVPQPWVNQLDMSTLEKVSGAFVADDLRTRASDVIWRVRWSEEWLYIYLLLEFQSTVDRHMAVRMLSYVGLLYQDLVSSGQLEEQGRLPPTGCHHPGRSLPNPLNSRTCNAKQALHYPAMPSKLGI